MSFIKTLAKTASYAIPSPIEVDFKTGGGSYVQKVAPYPPEVFWDESVPVHKTASGIEYVKTPEERFQHLPDYPFRPHYVEVNGLQMHYVAEGSQDGEVVLMLHGQPTWSYLYRKMITNLVARGYRCIAPDLIGMGKSDKPVAQKYHTYDQHCADILEFIQKLDLKNITVFVQDWGSLIGLRVVGENPDLFARVVLANGDLPLFTEENNTLYIPNPVVVNPKVKGLRASVAKYALRGMPDFFQAWILYCLTAPQIKPSETVALATHRKLSQGEKAAYDAPFPSFIYCAGPRTLPSMTAGMRGQTLPAWESLQKFEKPFLSLIGLKDNLLGRPDLQIKWIQAVPGAKNQLHSSFAKANHFIQEDLGEEMAARTHRFIHDNPR